MLLWKLSPTVQPGIGHCSTRYSMPRAFASLSSGTNTSSKNSEVLVHRQLLVAADEAAHGLQPQQRRGVHHAQHEVVLLLAQVVVVVQQVVEERDVGDADAGRLHRGRARAWRAPCRTACADRACWRPGRASPRAARRPRSGAARPRSGCSGSPARARTPASPRSRGRDPRRGSLRGVSSCSAAVRTLIFMNFGSNGRGVMGLLLG